MQNIRYEIVSSISKIKKADWDSIFGNILEGYNSYKAVEESALADFSFYYILLYRDDNIVCIAPVFTAEFDADIAISGALGNAIDFIRKFIPTFLTFKTLFCGSPFTEHGILGIRGGLLDKKRVIHELSKAMSAFCKTHKIPLIVFKDFLEEDEFIFDCLKERGFFKISSFPSVVTELNFDSMEGYFKSLGHTTRKSLRRKLKRAKTLGKIEMKIVDNVDATIDDIYRLYLNTYNAGKIRFERLTKEFFISMAKNLKPYIKFFLYYVDGKLAAFNLCLVYDNLFIDKFIGFDYDISNKYNLYFVSWCSNIDWCIKHSIRYYHTGQTDYHPKIKLGGRLIPLFAYIRHRGLVLNFFSRCLAQFLKPENFDRDIKKSIYV